MTRGRLTLVRGVLYGLAVVPSGVAVATGGATEVMVPVFVGGLLAAFGLEVWVVRRLTPADHVQCAFCKRSRATVKYLIAGPDGVAICDECTRLCSDLLAREQGGAGAPASADLLPPPTNPFAPPGQGAE